MCPGNQEKAGQTTFSLVRHRRKELTMERDKFTVSLIQMKIVPGDVEGNLKRAEDLINEASRSSPSVIFLPEVFATGFHYRDLAGMAKQAPAILTWARKQAKERGTALVFSIPVLENGKIYNAAFIVGKEGRTRGSYRKVHLFGLFREDRYFARGGETLISGVDGFRISPLICYDLRFPEIARKVTLQGASLIAYISQWPRERINHWKTLLPARALENQLFVVGVNGWGKSGPINLGGNSMVASPTGEILAKGGQGEGVVTASLDMRDLKRFREKMPCLKDRIPEAY
ncbi:MAG: carbon-nitrogen family hydrolase [Deltaproteobacteria bacterium]|nr:MAG: carbon-nitrogen family hydrolase [Deltaproteobacteria bacterium]